MATPPRDRPHLHVEGGGRNERYTSPRLVLTGLPPSRARAAHAARLKTQLDDAIVQARIHIAARDAEVAEGTAGFYLQFDIPVDHQSAIDSLENKRKAIELVAVRPPAEGETTVSATVFVPEAAADFYDRRIEAYRATESKSGNPRHEALIARIEEVHLGAARSLFTDDILLFPTGTVPAWWEVWLRDGRLATFKTVAQRLNVTVKNHIISFPERDVVLVLADETMMERLIQNSDAVAELRLAKDTPTFFVEMRAVEQAAWAANLAERLIPPSALAPAVCILDTGVNRAHPLIEPGLAVDDATAVESAWGPHDSGVWAGHGTEMAGLALYGDLVSVLESTQPVLLRHCLESVKILPPTGANEPDLYGAITAAAISRPEVQQPERNRVFSLAVTAPDEGDSGQPTSWSAAVDALAAGRSIDQQAGNLVYLDEAEPNAHRLFVVSAGNVPSDRLSVSHLDRSDIELVQDPAQSWNALSVAAFTEKAVITDPAYDAWTPVATSGELSPWSTTSCAFESAWPNKPDVVYEGGNVAHNESGDFDGGVADLCLLSTFYQPLVHPFVLTNATSAATAQVARMAAMIAVEYPKLWPETRRALLVQSARWTPRMQAAISGASGKTGLGALVRRYGFGVPNLARAIRSADDALTMVVESTIRPYADGKMREMHVHYLPWPTDVLADLHAATVRLRVTLSYFIEPNPARLGWKRRHRYASHALRFDVKTASESIPEFRKRLNTRALDEDEGKPATGSDSAEWLLGDRTRHKGSLHCDIWQGTAAALAARGVIGIYPVSGWWKDQPKRDRSEAGARYSLVVSIETEAEGVDIWTPVAQQVGVPVAIEGE